MSEIIASPGGTALATTGPRITAAPAMGSLLERVRGVMAQPAVAKSLPAALLVAVLGAAALVWATLSSPPQRDLFSGLDDGDKAAMVDTLKSAGIDYEIDSGTGALSVGEDDFHQARMLLAQAGLPKGAPSATSMLDSMPMGASRAVEGERLRGAAESDLARTIETIDAVESARVHLAVEQPSVFLRDRAAPAASVMLKLRGGRTLSDTQTRAIAQLVAASVPGMNADNVSIVDQSGRLLSSGGGDPAAQAASRQVELQQQIEQRYQEAVTKLLTPLVGAGNFTAEVHADLDFTETQATRESFPKDTAVVRAEQGGWAKELPGQAAMGVPGYLSNSAPGASTVTANNPAAPPATPPAGAPGAAPATAAAAGAIATAAPGTVPADRTSETFNRTFELGREVSVTRNPVGTVRRLSVAVALKNPDGKPRGKAEIAALEALVKGAVGFDQQRGDLIAVSARAFAAETVEQTPWYEASWVGMAARNLSALLVAALIVFGIARPLLGKNKAAKSAKTAAAAGASPAERQQIGEEMAAAVAATPVTNDGAPMVTLDMIEGAHSYEARAQLIRNFVRQDPARAALVVRDLIRADMNSSEDQNG